MPTGPRGYELRQASTQFLRVPVEDWTAVKHGYKSEFRLGQGIRKLASYPKLLTVPKPTPVVGYATRGQDTEYLMLVLDECWTEPVGAISEDSLEREGFQSMAHFRRYWMARTKERFSPLHTVQVFRVRLLQSADIAVVGAALFRQLYGEFTGADTESSLVSRRGPLAASVR